MSLEIYWLVTFITTFVPQGLLISVCEVSVPRQEVRLETSVQTSKRGNICAYRPVYCQGLIDMSVEKVVITSIK